ncbi:hypothetical protein AB1399_11010 [Hydrogenibacillus schlegelii]|uniref:Uncharacterized protein n=1 Tax=Hydrogenibacillus schlegelii TaxID=1484 RepID=A0A132NAZ7_HYDSH|nr:hypothetical protein [Hydrogenibacillus schlegelii]KWX07176.1 hypothetical protein TR75_03815 [Hydrogenibacillus schlegelii]OAR04587.1 hypothetical protein SA87_08585 [Hydrogenibacillus schlegelii]
MTSRDASKPIVAGRAPASLAVRPEVPCLARDAGATLAEILVGLSLVVAIAAVFLPFGEQFLRRAEGIRLGGAAARVEIDVVRAAVVARLMTETAKVDFSDDGSSQGSIGRAVWWVRTGGGVKVARVSERSPNTGPISYGFGQNGRVVPGTPNVRLTFGSVGGRCFGLATPTGVWYEKRCEGR